MSREPDYEAEKRAAARRSLDFVSDGMAVGLGSGSTASCFIELLGEAVRSGLRIRAVATSLHSEELARDAGIQLCDLGVLKRLDVTVDGADEIDPHLDLIKGGGGALLWEKIVASASDSLVIIGDSRKQVPVLGAFPLPVEVVPFGWQLVRDRIRELGATVSLRALRSGRPFQTVESNYILDCSFGRIEDPEGLAAALRSFPGVVEHGLFIDLASVVIIGHSEGVTVHQRMTNRSGGRKEAAC